MNWAYRREAGEPQITFNYVRALSDWLTNFTFSNGITFDVPEKYQHTVPALLERVWNKDNDKQKILWEIGNQGCTTPDAEALTPDGWMNLEQLQANPGIEIATINPESGKFEWQPAELNVFSYSGKLVKYKGQRIDHVYTPEHDMWVRQAKSENWKKRKAAVTSGYDWRVRGGAEDFSGSITIPVIEKTRLKPEVKFSDNRLYAQFIGWWVSEGYTSEDGRISVCQSPEVNPENYAEICDMLDEMSEIFDFTHKYASPNQRRFSHKGLSQWLITEFGRLDNERHLPRWVKELPVHCLSIILKTLHKGDGDSKEGTWRYSTVSSQLADDVQEIAVKLGFSTYKTKETRETQDIYRVHISENGVIALPPSGEVDYDGTVWCPTVPNGLWVMRQNGRAIVTGNSVQGDAFIKIAYEPAYTDIRNNPHPGKVRILPINASFCFPVDENEILTKRGWLTADELTVEDEALSLNTETDELVWSPVEAINIFDWNGPVHDWKGKHFSASSTSDHRWITQDYKGNSKMRTTEDINNIQASSLVLAAGKLSHFPEESIYENEFVELLGWSVTEGSLEGNAISIGQSRESNPDFCARIEKLASHFDDKGYKITRSKVYDDGRQLWYFPAALGKQLQNCMTTGKGIKPEFISSLTRHQVELLYGTILDGDGDTGRIGGRERLYQSTWPLMDSFQMLAMMLGKKSTAKLSAVSRNKFGRHDGTVAVHQSKTVNTKWLDKSVRHYTGRVWCPTTSTGTWVTRRKEVGINSGTYSKQVYLTGNCFPEW